MKTIVLAGRSPLFLLGIENAIQSLDLFSVIGRYQIWSALLEALSQRLPDLLVLDLSLEDQTARSYCQRISRAYPHLKVLIFKQEETPKVIKAFLKTGVRGYLLPTLPLESLGDALEVVGSGEHYLDPQLRSKLANHTLGLAASTDSKQLTPREMEVLQLIVEEHTTREIAEKLFISFCTVETHRLNLIQKLGVKNTAGLVREALQHQLYAY